MTTLRKLVQAFHRPIPTVGPFAVAVFVLAALPVTPDLDTARVTLTALHAQPPGENCSRCIKCSKCVRSPWGGGYCTYEGGCCREKGGNCNPALALSVPPNDSRAYGEDENLVVRLTGNVFGTWTCAAGQLAVAYREEESGVLVPVGNAELRDLEDRYSLAQYLAILADRPTPPRRSVLHDRTS